MDKTLEFIKKEKEVLEFWENNKIFEKSVTQRKDAHPFVFYEGPPTANGKPGIHHVLARSFKDLVCRYKTMKGFLVERKAGWDTHGLPVELEVEKELGFKNKNDIKNYGIGKFNSKAKSSVWHYLKEWEEMTKRMGYWIDLQHPYITFASDYIETVWWILKQASKKNLIAQSYKVLPYCPRCGTPLSSHEVSLGYKTVNDPSIYIKFQISHPQSEVLKNWQDKSASHKVYLLVWTTTPWTLPANVAVAVRPDWQYKIWQDGDDIIISFHQPPKKDDGKDVLLLGNIDGKDLVGEKYEPLYPVKKDNIDKDKILYQVVGADFITLDEGTGLVHIAPAFGEDDRQLGESKNLAFIQNIGKSGLFIEGPANLPELKGKFFKNADPIVFADLEKRGLLYKGDLQGTNHEYPFCWRCGTPLMYYAQEAWVIKMTQLKKELLSNNEKINWIPAHIKHGRFGQWLDDIKDWTISRKRYWGTPLPIWKCPKCGHYEVIGSLEELKEKAVDPSLVPPRNEKGEIDLHRPYVDKIKIKCSQCGAEMERVDDVLDCWFDSGSMPYAQWHWPFAQSANRDQAVQDLIKTIPFPADFICEAVDQTRGWFYTLLAISTILGVEPAYKNVISLGLILDAKGEKMSKSKGNTVNPMEIIDKYGVDSLRWYFYTMNPPGEEKRFSEKDLLSSQRRFLNVLWNIFHFYETYADKQSQEIKSLSVLDKWLLADWQITKEKITESLDKYDIQGAGRTLEDFVDGFSRWYLRRSRSVFQKQEYQQQRVASSAVLRLVLREVSLILAPFCPFFSEMTWRAIRNDKDEVSVHLADWPKVNLSYKNEELLKQMDIVRNIATEALRLRQEKGVKIRQPLSELKIKKSSTSLDSSLLDLLKEEINVKNITFQEKVASEIELDTQITPALQKEGDLREFKHSIQMLRRKIGLIPSDSITLHIQANDYWKQLIQESEGLIKRDLRVKDIIFELDSSLANKELTIRQDKLILQIIKINNNNNKN